MIVEKRQDFHGIYRDVITLSHERWKHFAANMNPEVTGIHIISGYELHYPGTVTPDMVCVQLSLGHTNFTGWPPPAFVLRYQMFGRIAVAKSPVKLCALLIWSRVIQACSQFYS